MKRLLSLLTLCLAAAGAAVSTGAAAQNQALTVAVAANMQSAFEEIRAEFTRRTGLQVKPVFNSSGRFVAQVMNGAPFDVFLSADMMYPERLHKEGFAAAPPRVYAYGTLVLWTMQPLDLSDWQRLLASPAVRKVAIANPKSAPYGREALNALRNLELEAPLKGKLVFGESVSQTNQYIHSRSVDAGITAKSVVLSPEMKDQGRWVELPGNSYQPIAQGVVVLKHGLDNNPKAAQQFSDFMLSRQARAVLQRYGYTLP